jgi:hypothetical protein
MKMKEIPVETATHTDTANTDAEKGGRDLSVLYMDNSC